MEKKGQVTLFVIIAMLIVVSGAIIFSVTGGIQSSKINAGENPRLFIQDCIEDDFEELVYIVSMNGGSVEPEFYHEFYGNNVEYLCTTAESYEPCLVNQPFLQKHIEEELETAIDSKVKSCISSLEEILKDKGFIVSSNLEGQKVEILPQRITLSLDYELSTTKADSNRFTEFAVTLNSNLYELVGVAKSIIEWEALLGDADILEYMAIYHNLDIRKNRVANQEKVFTIEDINTKEKFQFSTRSGVLPAGFS